MDQWRPVMAEGPTPKGDLGPLQERVWRGASIGIVLGTFAVVYAHVGFGDPVVAGIAAASALLSVWLTRKYVKSSLDEEKLRRWIDRHRR